MDFLKMGILICICGSLASTVFFLTWYNSDKSKINKKIKHFKTKGLYPNDSQSASFWDTKGWTEDSYNKFPSPQLEPELFKNTLFLEEMKTNEMIFKYFKISAFFTVFVVIASGILFEYITI